MVTKNEFKVICPKPGCNQEKIIDKTKYSEIPDHIVNTYSIFYTCEKCNSKVKINYANDNDFQNNVTRNSSTVINGHYIDLDVKDKGTSIDLDIKDIKTINLESTLIGIELNGSFKLPNPLPNLIARMPLDGSNAINSSDLEDINPYNSAGIALGKKIPTGYEFKLELKDAGTFSYTLPKGSVTYDEAAKIKLAFEKIIFFINKGKIPSVNTFKRIIDVKYKSESEKLYLLNKVDFIERKFDTNMSRLGTQLGDLIK